MKRSNLVLLAALFLAGLPAAAQPESSENDPVLRAMRDELNRSRGLRISNLDPPYYIEYALHDGETISASATLGGLVNSRRIRFRAPVIQVRVGDYNFDNTNYLGAGSFFGPSQEGEQFPLDNSYDVLRHQLWLATDRAYKSAVEAVARKRAALKNVTLSDELADFARAEPARTLINIRMAEVNEQLWESRVRSLSALFAGYPQIINSSIDFEAIQSTYYFVNSEAIEVRIPERLAYWPLRATGRAPDGMLVRDAVVLHSRDFDKMLSEEELRRSVLSLAENVSSLTRAPVGESYSGPVLFEGQAAAQLFAELLGRNLAIPRRPVSDPGRPLSLPASELEGRLGARILPEWMDVTDDPTQTEWRGRPLFGHYPVDLEGIPPRPLALVEAGVLKNFLLTRQPVKGFDKSNGRARLPGNFGAKAAGFGNLFVRASETVSPAELKKKMLDLCRLRDKPYGIIVRKMDFPSSASFDELRRLLTRMAQSGGSARPVSLPVLVYRLYQDGREELVRGLRFRGLTTRSLKEIVAASDESHVFDFLDNTAPFAVIGGGGFVAESSAIAPSVLFDDLELDKSEEELPKLPVVPPPQLKKGTDAF